MTEMYRDKTIRGFIEIIPKYSKEEDMPIIERKIGVALGEYERDEFVFFDAEVGGYKLRFQLNYDWDLSEEEKNNIGLDITSFYEDRVRSGSDKLPEFICNIPDNLRVNKYGDIDISKYLSESIAKLTGYQCNWEWPDEE